ncbi:MAG: CDP-alcohol phosphatidyltransferase family protein [Verrucomicrobiales bacterium]
MNLPNKLTVSRLLLTVCFVIALTLDQVLPLAHSLAALFSSWRLSPTGLDGYLARKYHLITSFGKLMDPLADKVLMCAGFVMLSDLHSFPVGWSSPS